MGTVMMMMIRKRKTEKKKFRRRRGESRNTPNHAHNHQAHLLHHLAPAPWLDPSGGVKDWSRHISEPSIHLSHAKHNLLTKHQAPNSCSRSSPAIIPSHPSTKIHPGILYLSLNDFLLHKIQQKTLNPDKSFPYPLPRDMMECNIPCATLNPRSSIQLRNGEDI